MNTLSFLSYFLIDCMVLGISAISGESSRLTLNTDMFNVLSSAQKLSTVVLSLHGLYLVINFLMN